MRFFPVLVVPMLVAFAAPPAAAGDLCDELWFTRNLVYDRAGYCFASALGRAVFDNSNCISQKVEPDPAEYPIVVAVQAAEREFGCDVDTRRRSLDVAHLPQRMAMVDIPVPSGYESACIGWLGRAIPLHLARSNDSPVSGMIQTGDTIYFGFESVNGWNFIVMPDGPADMGWMRDPAFSWDACDRTAG